MDLFLGRNGLKSSKAGRQHRASKSVRHTLVLRPPEQSTAEETSSGSITRLARTGHIRRLGDLDNLHSVPSLASSGTNVLVDGRYWWMIEPESPLYWDPKN